MKNFNSAIESLQIIIRDLKENLNDCKLCFDTETARIIKNDIKEHEEAIEVLKNSN